MEKLLNYSDNDSVWKPAITVLPATENKCRYEVVFCEALEIFKGHFKSFKVVPGVVLIHLLHQLIGKGSSKFTLNKIKFAKPITPDCKCIIEIEAQSDQIKVIGYLRDALAFSGQFRKIEG